MGLHLHPRTIIRASSQPRSFGSRVSVRERGFFLACSTGKSTAGAATDAAAARLRACDEMSVIDDRVIDDDDDAAVATNNGSEASRRLHAVGDDQRPA
jgi:hypothetical protein